MSFLQQASTKKQFLIDCYESGNETRPSGRSAGESRAPSDAMRYPKKVA